MKRLLLLIARLYPSSWRARYGLELEGLLDDVRPRFSDLTDLLTGALKMRILRSNVAAFAAVVALAGAICATAISFAIPNRYVANGVFAVHSSKAQTTPGSPLIVSALAREVFSRKSLTSIMEKNDLYREERANQPLEDVIETMRRNIRITSVPLASAFSVSFMYPDPAKALRATEELVHAFVSANVSRSRQPDEASTLEIIELPHLPQSPVAPNRLTAASIGLGAGALVGAVVGWLRRPSSKRA